MAEVWDTMKTTFSCSVSSFQLRPHPSCWRLVSLMSPASTASPQPATLQHTETVLGLRGHQKRETWWFLVIKMTSAIRPTPIFISLPPCPSVQCQCSGKLPLGPRVRDTLWWRHHHLRHHGDRGQRGGWCAGFCSNSCWERGAVSSHLRVLIYAKIR